MSMGKLNNEVATYVNIPMAFVGPVKIVGPEVTAELPVPLATFETPLWPSVNRGARVSVQSGGVRAVVVDERMTRSVLLEATDAIQAVAARNELLKEQDSLAKITTETSRFTKLVDIHSQVVGPLLFLRFEFTTGDAAGHNMVTAAADRLIAWILGRHPTLSYGSISGNYCTDKKVSAVNGILGRGKYVIVEATIPQRIVQRYLKTSPEKITDLNWKKNWIGTSLAGGLRSANAHFANMLLAFYLATGQDAANIIEGSQGFTHAEVRDGDLYFSVTLPNIIVGAVGSGKGLDFARENLRALGCLDQRDPGANARRLAILAGAVVWCGELSLLAAQTNPGELMKTHLEMERS